MLVEKYDIQKINPASYNPRYLSEDKKQRLIESISEVGFLKPIIINSNNTIIAGHQRSKCMLILGKTHVPAFIIDGITKTDEVRFNQLHNGSDIEIGNGDIVKINTDKIGWHYVKPSQIEIVKLGRNAQQKKELSRLFLKYGEFGSCVLDIENNCIISSDYASVCKMMNKELFVYKESDLSQITKIKKYFALSYGEFNYDLLKKQTYIQCLAQMNRLAGDKQLKSTLYERVVIPNITKTERILDFGAGKMAYVKKLKSEGYNIVGLEFYLRKKSLNAIDYKKVIELIDHVIQDIKENGLFDSVICDSVLNSVDSMEAHTSVINTIRTLCKPNGKLFFSGRCIESTQKQERQDKTRTKGNFLYFYDKNLFTANFRSGNWFYQKFHSVEMVKEICKSISKNNVEITRHLSSGFQCRVKNDIPLSNTEKINAIDFEFNLPLPSGKTYNKNKELKEILGL